MAFLTSSTNSRKTGTGNLANALLRADTGPVLSEKLPALTPGDLNAELDYATDAATGNLYALRWVRIVASTSGLKKIITADTGGPGGLRTTVEWRGPDELPPVAGFSEDLPEVSALSDEEIKTAIRAQFGMWVERNDLDEDWPRRIRQEWGQRLQRLYGDDTLPV